MARNSNNPIFPSDFDINAYEAFLAESAIGAVNDQEEEAAMIADHEARVGYDAMVFAAGC